MPFKLILNTFILENDNRNLLIGQIYHYYKNIKMSSFKSSSFEFLLYLINILKTNKHATDKDVVFLIHNKVTHFVYV